LPAAWEKASSKLAARANKPAAMMTGLLNGLGKKVVWVFGGMN